MTIEEEEETSAEPRVFDVCTRGIEWGFGFNLRRTPYANVLTYRSSYV